MGLSNVLKEVCFSVKSDGFSTETDPTRDFSNLVSVVQLRGEEERIHPPLMIVMSGLEKRRTLPGIHGGVVKIEFSHRFLWGLASSFRIIHAPLELKSQFDKLRPEWVTGLYVGGLRIGEYSPRRDPIWLAGSDSSG